jgi:hypothetical protein
VWRAVREADDKEEYTSSKVEKEEDSQAGLLNFLSGLLGLDDAKDDDSDPHPSVPEAEKLLKDIFDDIAGDLVEGIK